MVLADQEDKKMKSNNPASQIEFEFDGINGLAVRGDTGKYDWILYGGCGFQYSAAIEQATIIHEYEFEAIGKLSNGDQYGLVTRLDDDININQLHDYINDHYHYDRGHWFCTSHSLVLCENSKNKAIVTLHHRKDV
jgi:hypothetical protein